MLFRARGGTSALSRGKQFGSALRQVPSLKTSALSPVMSETFKDIPEFFEVCKVLPSENKNIKPLIEIGRQGRIANRPHRHAQ